jgi:hypothetical protein
MSDELTLRPAYDSNGRVSMSRTLFNSIVGVIVAACLGALGVSLVYAYNQGSKDADARFLALSVAAVNKKVEENAADTKDTLRTLDRSVNNINIALTIANDKIEYLYKISGGPEKR